MHRSTLLRNIIVTAPSRVSVRCKSRKTRLAPGTELTEKALWSNDEVGQHPGPPDCPMGNKGQYPQNLPDGGKQYFGFIYYPRYPDQEDPTVESAPLHLVTRTRCLKGKPWWDREIMKIIGLAGKRSDVSVMKNNPENNAMLWRVKHLIKVTPLKVPVDLPKDIDPKDCFIKETGEFYHIPNIGISKEKLEEDEQLSKPSFEGYHLLKEARKRWEDGWEVKMK